MNDSWLDQYTAYVTRPHEQSIRFVKRGIKPYGTKVSTRLKGETLSGYKTLLGLFTIIYLKENSINE